MGGSVEVLTDLLTKLSNEKVKITIVRASVGAITESDVLLASASNAVIIGFNVRPERKAQELAEQEKVDIRLHSIIYELQDEMKRAMTGLLEPIIKETYLGRAEVKDTFRIPKVGTIAGCQVVDGSSSAIPTFACCATTWWCSRARSDRCGASKTMPGKSRNGMECGIGIANYGDIKAGDVIEAFVTEKVAAEALVKAHLQPKRGRVASGSEALPSPRLSRSANMSRTVLATRGPISGTSCNRTTNMIAHLTLEIRIEGAHSLKDKRQVVRSVKDGLRTHFNVSVAEIDPSDAWQRATLGVVSISSSRDYLDGLMRNVERFAVRAANNSGGEVTDSFLDFLSEAEIRRPMTGGTVMVITAELTQ